MQAIDNSGINRLRDKAGAALDQNPVEAKARPGTGKIRQGEMPALIHGEMDKLHAVRQSLLRCGSITEDDPARAVLASEAFRRRRQLAAGIDNDPGRVAARTTTDIQLRVIGLHGADAHDDSVDMGPDAVQVVKRRGRTYISAVARPGGDPPVKGLAQLGHDEGPFGMHSPEGPEQGCRLGGHGRDLPKRAAKLSDRRRSCCGSHNSKAMFRYGVHPAE